MGLLSNQISRSLFGNGKCFLAIVRPLPVYFDWHFCENHCSSLYFDSLIFLHCFRSACFSLVKSSCDSLSVFPISDIFTLNFYWHSIAFFYSNFTILGRLFIYLFSRFLIRLCSRDHIKDFSRFSDTSGISDIWWNSKTFSRFARFRDFRFTTISSTRSLAGLEGRELYQDRVPESW